MKTEPQEVTINYSHGFKVQVKKFDINETVSFSVTERHAVEDATEEELEAFKAERLEKLREFVDPIAQDEFDALWDLRKSTGE